MRYRVRKNEAACGFFRFAFELRPNRSILLVLGTAAGVRLATGLARRAAHPATAVSVRMRTKLYAAAPNVNIHPTLARPRCRTLRSSATLFNHPNISSIRLRLLWLTAKLPCRVVRASTWL